MNANEIARAASPYSSLTRRALIATLEYQGHRVDSDIDVCPERFVIRVDRGETLSFPVHTHNLTRDRYAFIGDLLVNIDG